MSERAAIVVLTENGRALARRLAAVLPDAELHGLTGRVADADVIFEAVPMQLQSLFAAGRPVIGICAAGILIRALAPLLADKRAEPPVLALAEDGSAVVPLLGGHRGANELASRIGEALAVAPAVTTSGDRRFGVALDAPPAGWRLANPEDYKAFVARLLAGESLRLEGEADWLTRSHLPFDDDGELVIRVTDRARGSAPDGPCFETRLSAAPQHEDGILSPKHQPHPEEPRSGVSKDGWPTRSSGRLELVYHPAVLTLGVGCERGADPEELAALVHTTLAEQGLAAGALAGVYSIDVKADETAVHALAERLGVPSRFFDAATLEAETPRLATPSDLVFREVGCHGVAEGAALAAAGPEGELIAAKTKSKRATCAIARATAPIGAVGRPRGRLAVLGIGPGDRSWRTPEAEAAVLGATDLIGYGLYLDLLGPLAEGKARHGYELGEEELRVRVALDLAAAGRSVALVCSGDPGIYAMASLVFELLERGGRPDWGRSEITVVPGISALQAAAARIGAPLGHDFCAISLSDLLTPWPVIEKRLRAAAAGDFVIAFYNPVSKRRRHQLATAVEILRGQRPGDTPVVLARNLGRESETVTVIDLAELEPERVDMLTVVLVGASTSRRVARGEGGCWVYTPRGYGAKAEKNSEDAA